MKPEPNLFDPIVGPICYCVPNGASACATCRERRADAEAEAKFPLYGVSLQVEFTHAIRKRIEALWASSEADV